MEIEAMTWSVKLIVGLALLFGWVTGIAMLQFPGGIHTILLRKTAQLGLWIAENCEWCYMIWTHARIWTPVGRITYYEMLQYGAQDPEKAIRTYMPWAIPFVRFYALIWLGGTILATINFSQIVIQGG